MAETKTSVANKPAWVELSSSDAAASRDFYSKLFGWKIEVNPDPQYGGYGMAKVEGNPNDVAGIGPKMSPETPTAWSVYIGTADAAETTKKVAQAGGKVVMEPMEVPGQGTMAVFQDPSGAFISVWQPANMGGFHQGKANTFGWAELSARGVEKAKPFYTKLFGWAEKKTPMGEGQKGEYTEFLSGGESIAGAMEMPEMVPAQVPSYWLIYFNVDDVDKATKKAVDLGGKTVLEPQDFPYGRFSIVSDPQGAAFGLVKQ
jgi:predicted enzyme related to lactoylglutathione lyase